MQHADIAGITPAVTLIKVPLLLHGSQGRLPIGTREMFLTIADCHTGLGGLFIYQNHSGGEKKGLNVSLPAIHNRGSMPDI